LAPETGIDRQRDATATLTIMKKLLVTGSSGLIGSAVAESFHSRGWEIFGADNNMRADFFGPEGDTLWNLKRLSRELKHFTHNDLDIRNRERVLALVAQIKPDAIVHCAAQPSHDLAAKRPFEDFDVNAVGTLNLLESARRVSTGLFSFTCPPIRFTGMRPIGSLSTNCPRVGIMPTPLFKMESPRR
jgi:nucleoside-diphosphate-sugar epimerase